MMTPRQRHWLAGALGTGLVLTLVIVASLDTLGGLEAPQRFALTEITTFEAPAPPPPPAQKPNDARSGGSKGAQLLAFDSRRSPVMLEQMQIDVQFAAATLGDVELGKLGAGIGTGSGDGTGDGSGGGFGLAMLSELDQQPTVISAPVFPYPDEAIQQGIGAFDLQFHIVIDEEGFVYPIAMVVNPLPELNARFLEYASNVRFSPPTRLGIPVRTEYLWPVRVKR